MSEYALGVFFASWEPRFRLGIERDLATCQFLNVVIFYSEEYRDWTTNDRAVVSDYFASAGITYEFVSLDHRSAKDTWDTVRQSINSRGEIAGDAFIDISTMPRDVLWTCLTSLSQQNRKVDYVYHQPDEYGPWLSADPRKPRMLYRHSGVSELDKPLAVLATTGYDFDRTVQLYTTFEPKSLMLAIQIGGQYNNVDMNIRDHLNWATGKRGEGVVTFDVDAYSEDHGLQSLREHLLPIKDTHNIVLAALGPKTSSVAIYKLWREFPQSALSYIPCQKYSRNYSKGIGDTKLGTLE